MRHTDEMRRSEAAALNTDVPDATTDDRNMPGDRSEEADLDTRADDLDTDRPAGAQTADYPDTDRAAEAETVERTTPTDSADEVDEVDEVGAASGYVADTRREADDEVTSFWSADAQNGVRQRWHEVQLQFVDDPQAAVEEASRLVSEAIDTLTRSLAEQRSRLEQGRSAAPADTEQLRVAVKRHRELLDRVLSI